MTTFWQVGSMVASAFLIIIADSLIKKVSTSGAGNVYLHPLMLLSYFLYFIQIVIAFYVFKYGGGLAVYTNLFIVFYSIFGVLMGVFVFSESLSLIQGIGIVLAMTGAVLLNIR